MSDMEYDPTDLLNGITLVLEMTLEMIWNTSTGTGLLPELWWVFYEAITGGEMLYALFILCFAGGVAAAIKYHFWRNN